MEQQAELSVNTSQKNKKQIFIYVLSSISMLASVACVSFVLAVVLLPELSTRIRTFFLVMLGAAVFSLLSVILFFIAGKNVKSRRKIMHAVLQLQERGQNLQSAHRSVGSSFKRRIRGHYY